MGIFGDNQRAYAARGIATFPVIIDEEGKRPAVRNYLKIGIPASEQLVFRFGDHNALGVACGVANGITVLDVDTPDENVLADALTTHGDTPFVVRTGSGNWHAWYRHNGERRRIRPFAGRPVDILGDGYVVAPPSRGTRLAYEIIRGSLDDLQHLPRMAGVPLAPASNESSAAPASAGQRNNTLWGACMRRAPQVGTINELLLFAREANADFDPPLSDREVTKIVKSAWQKTEAGRNYFGVESHVRFYSEEIDTLAAQNADAFALFAILRRNHNADATFALAPKSMAPALGWTVQRFRHARQYLEDQGRLRLVYRGGKGEGDASRWQLSRGVKSHPNTNNTPSPPSPPGGEEGFDPSSQSLSYSQER